MSYGDEYHPALAKSLLKGGGKIGDHKSEPSDILLVMTKQKPWYKSSAILGSLASIVMVVLGLFGLVSTLSPEELISIVASIFAAVSSIITSVWSIIGSFRRTAKIEPIFKAEVITDQDP